MLDRDEKLVGVATGRSYTYYFREMISCASIDIAESKIGNEVVVVWGDPGQRQKHVRAKVARHPHLTDYRNQTYHVSQVPSGVGAA